MDTYNALARDIFRELIEINHGHHNDHRAHWLDERLAVKSFYTGNEFFYQYLKAITAK
jgi:hypothetical protein